MNSLLDSLSGIYQTLAEKTDIDELLEKLICQAVRSTRVESGIISLYDKMTTELYYHRRCIANEKFDQYDWFEETFRRVKPGEGILGWCAEHREIVNKTNPGKDIRFQNSPRRKEIQLLHSVLAIPLVFQEELQGVMVLFNKKTASAFSKQDEKYATIIAAQLSLLIYGNRLTKEQLSRERLTDLGQSIVNSAHGLKNILNNMDGGTYIVQTGVSQKSMDMVDEGWDIIKRNSRRLRELVVDMLLYSRPHTPEYQETDIVQLCQDLVDLVSERATRQNVEVTLEAAPDIGTFHVDPKAIHRAILNLISNAIHACGMKHGGKVHIRINKAENDSLEIKIQDDGIGISQDNLEHIFEVFFTTKGSKGTGLGLPVTQKIIAEHQGTLKVNSEVNMGTTFTITLPKFQTMKNNFVTPDSNVSTV